MAIKPRFPWVTVSAAVAAVVVTVVAWLQVPAPVATFSGNGQRPPVLGLTRLDSGSAAEVMAERLAAYDPTPLFLPTDVNSQPDSRRLSGQSDAKGPFAQLSPELVKTSGLQFPPLVSVPSGPVQGLALSEQQQAPLALGRIDGAGGPLTSRLAQVDVVTTESGRVVLQLSLPPSNELASNDWQPIELMGSVSRAGLVGDLVVTASSGLDAIDDYFRSHLAQSVRIGDRLPAGVYVFRVGP